MFCEKAFASISLGVQGHLESLFVDTCFHESVVIGTVLRQHGFLLLVWSRKKEFKIIIIINILAWLKTPGQWYLLFIKWYLQRVEHLSLSLLINLDKIHLNFRLELSLAIFTPVLSRKKSKNWQLSTIDLQMTIFKSMHLSLSAIYNLIIKTRKQGKQRISINYKLSC